MAWTFALGFDDAIDFKHIGKRSSVDIRKNFLEPNAVPKKQPTGRNKKSPCVSNAHRGIVFSFFFFFP